MNVEDTHGTEILICSLTSKISIATSILNVTSEFQKNVWYQILKTKCMKPQSRQLHDHFATRKKYLFNWQWLIAGSSPETQRSYIPYYFYANIAVSDLDNPIILGNGGLGKLIH